MHVVTRGLTGDLPVSGGYFFFFLESIRLISLRLCGVPVPSPLKVRYTHGKTGYISVLPSKPKKCLKEYPLPPPHSLPVHPRIGKCLLHHAPTGPPYTYMNLPPPRPFRPSPIELVRKTRNQEISEINAGQS